ncbi:hypothetical protein TGAMA5MH_06605 [Trichoderma gamsii]|uniref:Uncharacterized protein n=1 Tax=Trichoderma gamsii TaxID=398673 RepID=A0A2K0T7K1_9HYPO|nr:hypothetical protein TGAMA5MH_06605 [Trichoderma gamsii]
MVSVHMMNTYAVSKQKSKYVGAVASIGHITNVCAVSHK